MNEVVFKTLKEKNFILKSFLIKLAIDLNLNIDDLLLLTYFMNQESPVLNPPVITSAIYLPEERIILSFQKLLELKLITIKIEKDKKGVIHELINLDNLIKFATTDITSQHKSEEKGDIYEKFETEFGRTLTPMEYEIINDWINRGISKELIIQALREATYNGAKSLRYINKILDTWKEKGYKTRDDVNDGMRKESENTVLTDLIDINWLDEE